MATTTTTKGGPRAGYQQVAAHRAVVTEVLYVRIPLDLKVELEAVAERFGVSLAYAASRAVERYLTDLCDVALPPRPDSLP